MSPRWCESSRVRGAACVPARQSSSCACRLGCRQCGPGTTGPVRSPSETAESARRVGSCHGGPGRCRLWRALVLAASRRSRPASPSVGGVPALHDAVETLRQFILAIALEPDRLDQAAAQRGGGLLILAGGAVFAAGLPDAV